MVHNVEGVWKALTDNVNLMVRFLLFPSSPSQAHPHLLRYPSGSESHHTSTIYRCRVSIPSFLQSSDVFSPRADLLSFSAFPRSTTAVAAGDLSKSITVDAQGEILQLKVRRVPFFLRRRRKLTFAFPFRFAEHRQQHGGKSQQLLVGGNQGSQGGRNVRSARWSSSSRRS